MPQALFLPHAPAPERGLFFYLFPHFPFLNYRKPPLLTLF
nr:MAG TPA: hypothetical protein [Caudoviricetes sp.]